MAQRSTQLLYGSEILISTIQLRIQPTNVPMAIIRIKTISLIHSLVIFVFTIIDNIDYSFRANVAYIFYGIEE